MTDVTSQPKKTRQINHFTQENYSCTPCVPMFYFGSGCSSMLEHWIFCFKITSQMRLFRRNKFIKQKIPTFIYMYTQLSMLFNFFKEKEEKQGKESA